MRRDDTVERARSQSRSAAEAAREGALAGLGDAEAAARLLTRLRVPVSWPDIAGEARRLHLAPLFHLALHAFPRLRARVPPSIAEDLRRAAHAAAVRLTHLERACADVVEAATTAGIQVLVLKGLALGALAYPSPAARPMDDVDLLVAAADRERLATLLRGLGYRNDLRGEEDFCPADLRYGIDVQTALLNTTRVPARGALWAARFEDLWARRQGFRLGAVPAYTLGPPDTLAHLAVHAVHHHGLTGALWMVDLVACLRAWPPAPDDILGAPPAVRRSLWYCLEVLAAQGPDPAPEVRVALRPPRAFPMERRLLAAITRGQTPEAARYVLTLVCLPGWRARAEFVRQLALPAMDAWKGFEDAGGGSPGFASHWGQAFGLGASVLRGLLRPRKVPAARRGSF